jgi:RimJ/RimL family protein N-acetyltransferase
MKINARKLSEISIQTVSIDDADELLEYTNNIIKEKNPFIPLNIDEIPSSPKDYAEIIKKQLDTGVSTTLLAIHNEKIIGRLDIGGHQRRAFRHVVSLAISVEKPYRRIGLGSALLTKAISWIEERQYIKRIEIEVHTSNIKAINLYKQFGFIEEGIFKCRIYHEEKYEDTLRLALFT